MSHSLVAKPGPISDADHKARLDRIAAMPEMGADNINIPPETVAKWSSRFGVVGVLGLLLTLIGAFVVNTNHALAAFEVGLFVLTAASLGSLGLTMIFHSVNAGWHITIRRVMEKIASMLPLCLLGLFVCLIIELLPIHKGGSGVLLTWLRPEAQASHLMEVKRPFLNIPFVLIRFAVYAAIWTFLSTKMLSWSKEQDRTGDPALSRKMRFNSGWGLLAFALSLAFFSFDFLMAMDFRFFSTMFGVYFFAIGMLASVSLIAVILAALRLSGRLTGVVTQEHFHDLGKFIFVFTCFWAYIAFSQYFLIWYSNIPEETRWFVHRQTNGWKTLFVILALAHFVVPFILFVSRAPKRSTLGLAFMGVYSLIVTVLDVIYIIRPMVYTDAAWTPDLAAATPANWWLDIAGLAAAAGIYFFFLIKKLGDGPLVPLKDPMLPESMAHKNYV
ncbi:MAG: hypothetical protein ACI89L_002409 [Phycisphaerales bacterium]|jgi:hypothetical protein